MRSKPFLWHGRYTGPLEQVNDYCWRIPQSYKPGMRVDGLIYANRELIDLIRVDQAPEQVANVAFLPGIQLASLAMPDIHWGYGFCIGGVCATDPAEGGVISPGGVGYDINCGVRLDAHSNLFCWTMCSRILRQLVEELFRQVPTGVGRAGKYSFDRKPLRRLIGRRPELACSSAAWPRPATSNTPKPTAGSTAPTPTLVSDRALARGADQCGTLGSGNHFLEVQVVDQVFDEPAAAAMGLEADMVCVMIHSGSRGLGYQVCDDALQALRRAPEKYGITLARPAVGLCPDRQPRRPALPGSHACGGQLCLVQSATADVAGPRSVRNRVGPSWQQMQMNLVYDVAHNIAKLERHTDRRAREAGVGASQGSHAGVSARASRSARHVPGHRPAGDHSRRHGPGQLGAGRPGRQHGADVRHGLPWRRAA